MKKVLGNPYGIEWVVTESQKIAIKAKNMTHVINLKKNMILIKEMEI